MILFNSKHCHLADHFEVCRLNSFFPLKNHVANSSSAEWSYICHRCRILAYIFFAVFPSAIPMWIVLRTSITSRDANGSSIVYLDTNNAETRIFINRLGAFFSILETQNEHFPVISVAIGHIARELWAKGNYFWNDPRSIRYAILTENVVFIFGVRHPLPQKCSYPQRLFFTVILKNIDFFWKNC